MVLNEQQKKEARMKSYLKYCKSDKGKEAIRRALQKYYQKNRTKIIEKNMKYYNETYSKVISVKRGTGKKKGANYTVIDGKKIINNKSYNIYTPALKVINLEKTIEPTYLIKDSSNNKHYKLTAKEYKDQQKTNSNLSIILNFD